VVRLGNEGDIRGITMEMDIVATRRLNEVSSRPHANAPAVSVVLANLVIPLPSFLASDLPKVTLSPIHRLATSAKELGTNPMGGVVVALVIAIPIALTWARRDLLLANRSGLYFLSESLLGRCNANDSGHDEKRLEIHPASLCDGTKMQSNEVLGL